MSLATMYRPITFDDVVGQEIIKTIILNQIEKKEIHQSYLFTGGAGTGKTTCARIMANMLNDVVSPIELDGASNNGVDDVRNIIEESRFKPLLGEFKVFIIDECHMLSIQAWNALLKVVEEPPKHVVFIFCTTNPTKIPRTIISRTQIFNFNNISEKGIVSRLTFILEKESCNKPIKDVFGENWESVIKLIASASSGCMRYAITLLEKVIGYGELADENFYKAVGMETNPHSFYGITDNIFNKKGKLALEKLDELNNVGFNMHEFRRSYFRYLLDCVKYVKYGIKEYSCLPKDSEFLKLVKNQLGEKNNLEKILKMISDLDYFDKKQDIYYVLSAWVVELCN